MESIDKFEILVSNARQEADKFYNKGNNAAGTRLRTLMQEIKVLATQVRADVSERKNAAKEK